MQFFRDLGSLVEQRWRDESYNEEVFPEIAEQALAETAPHGQVDPWDVIRWLNTTTELPEQRDIPGMFGNPPVTLYNGPRFYIDIYYWLDGTTSIHRHAFCGAFQVLQGSSIHSQYDFNEQRRINEHCLVGEITLTKVELLETGAIRQILPGARYIHSLFHLERPSVSLVIRTQQVPSVLPQYDYHKPYLALNPFFQSAALIKRFQAASLLLSMKHPQADDLIGELLSCSDFQTAFAVIELAFNHLANNQLEKAFGLSTGKKRFEGLLEIARQRHGELADLILPVIEERQRQKNIIQRRGEVTSHDHRFFLALLLNVPDRERVLELVGQRFPACDPVEQIVEWVEELAATRRLGGGEANVLGLEKCDDDYLFVLRCLLAGLSRDRMQEEASAEYADDYTAGLRDKLAALYDAICSSLLFKSIFGELAAARSEVMADGVLAQVG